MRKLHKIGALPAAARKVMDLKSVRRGGGDRNPQNLPPMSKKTCPIFIVYS